MTTKEKIESLRDEFNKKLDDLLKEYKLGFEVGKWYKSDTCIYNYPTGFGFMSGGRWTDGVSVGWEQYRFCPATLDKVKAALVKEAEKRGFKEGVTVDRANLKLEGFHHEIEILETSQPDYYADKDNLNIGGVCVYYKGKWAEIIKESPLMVGSYEVKFYSDHIMVGCQVVSNDLLKKIYEKQIIQP